MPGRAAELEIAISNRLRELKLTFKTIEDIEEEEEEVMRVKIFPALLPVRTNRFEAEHIENRRVGSTPCRQIAEHLGLKSQPQTFDFFESHGRRASVTCGFGDDIWRNKQDATLLRRDLLQRYLHETNTALLWVISGERGFSAHHIEFRSFADHYPPYAPFQIVERFL